MIWLPVVYLAVVTPRLVAYDLGEHRLPNRLVVPGILVGVVSWAGQWWLTGSMPTIAPIAALVFAGFLLVLNLMGGMGMGDVKLAAALGLASWNVDLAVLSPLIAFMGGGVASGVLLVRGRRGRRTRPARLAFGPFLLGGYWCALAVVLLVH